MNIVKNKTEYHSVQVARKDYSAANFCFNKGLCMIWNKGTLSEHK